MDTDRGGYEVELVIKKKVLVQGRTKEDAIENAKDLVDNISWNPQRYDCFSTNSVTHCDIVSTRKLSRHEIPGISM